MAIFILEYNISIQFADYTFNHSHTNKFTFLYFFYTFFILFFSNFIYKISAPKN